MQRDGTDFFDAQDSYQENLRKGNASLATSARHPAQPVRRDRWSSQISAASESPATSIQLHGSGKTPLMLAAAAGHRDVVERLLQGGDADWKQRNAEGDSALGLAISNNHPGVVAAQIGNGAAVETSLRAELLMAMRLKRADILEIFILHGHLPEETDFDFANQAQAAFMSVIADLSAYQRLSGLMLPADKQATAYFKQMFDVFERSNDAQSTLQWLREQGMAASYALLLVGSLSKLREKSRMMGANERLLNLASLSALHRLSTPEMASRVTQPYRSAGISAAAAERLELRANWQLSEIARMAKFAVEATNREMMKETIDICVAETGPDGQVRTDFLIGKLIEKGFGRIFADLIALSWSIASTAVQAEHSAGTPAGETAAMDTSTTHTPVAEWTPAVFWQELLHLLYSLDEFGEPDGITSGQVEEICKSLFFIQWDALQKTCLVNIEQLPSGFTPALQE